MIRWWCMGKFFHREVQPTSSFPHCQQFSRQFHITIPRQNMLLFNTMFAAQAALSLRALHAFLERIYRINGYECHTCLVFVNRIFFENTSEKTHLFLWHLSKNNKKHQSITGKPWFSLPLNIGWISWEFQLVKVRDMPETGTWPGPSLLNIQVWNSPGRN